jgi:predicted O-methyltransferase YrrM
VNRRASLPGADELFGSKARSSRPDEGPAAEAGSDARVLAEVRRLTAVEEAPLLAARDRAGERYAPPSPEVGALLRWAVTTCGARTVVEIGAAGGVSGLWLLAALPTGGVLTSIEPDPHGHELAAEAFASVPSRSKVRSILGDPATVLPRLSDGAYDLALLQAVPNGYPQDLVHARRLLRPGGMLIARGVLHHGEHGDALARFVQDLAEDPAFSAVVLPVDDGLALATRTETAR